MQTQWASKINPVMQNFNNSFTYDKDVNLIIQNPVLFPTPGGTASIFNYYEEGSFKANFNQSAGAGGTNTIYNILFTRIGKVVTLLVPAQSIVAGATSASVATDISMVPSRIAPVTADISVPCRVQSNGVQMNPGILTIGRDGSMTIFRIFDGSVTFGSGQTIGIFQRTLPVTYTIQ